MGRVSFLLAVGVIGSTGVISIVSARPVGSYMATDSTSAKSPVVVELFTSEGCSSCPPADRLLAKIHELDPSIIVLSEHVTYWNDIGWRDPFSSPESTSRQSDYVGRMRLSSSYTPQMVVNGQYEFVGSDARAAANAIQKASAQPETPVTISNLKVNGDHLGFEVETGKLETGAQLLMILVQDEGIERVSNGENGGKTLRHIQIARSIRTVADVKSGTGYKAALSAELPHATAGGGWHLVFILQRGPGGPIIGAASQAVRGENSILPHSNDAMGSSVI